MSRASVVSWIRLHLEEFERGNAKHESQNSLRQTRLLDSAQFLWPPRSPNLNAQRRETHRMGSRRSSKVEVRKIGVVHAMGVLGFLAHQCTSMHTNAHHLGLVHTNALHLGFHAHHFRTLSGGLISVCGGARPLSRRRFDPLRAAERPVPTSAATCSWATSATGTSTRSFERQLRGCAARCHRQPDYRRQSLGN
jgi:hypothetical protein